MMASVNSFVMKTRGKIVGFLRASVPLWLVRGQAAAISS
jgi:hypothetical protein